ncbi:MAG TPA: HIT family protein [Dehalococcoidia bacterium]|jgi:histidine triad (HIT) family protein|nr:HIT family protein [Dehalococcoidia bacterium]
MSDYDDSPVLIEPGNPCIFCEIVAGRAPASVTYEDNRVLGFLTVGPVTPSHLMVIPKRHYAFVAEMDEETGAHLFRASMRMAAALRNSGLRCEGVNWFLADGEAAFQEIFHVHLHVFPRFRGDTFKLDADWSVHPPREELDATAAQIRAAYADPSAGRHSSEGLG